MEREAYLEQIGEWLKGRDCGRGIRESFRLPKDACGVPEECLLSYTGWLVLPGEEGAAGMSQEAAREWNGILFSAFARTSIYGQAERVLWDRLERLSERLQTEAETHGTACRLLERAVPAGERELVGREQEIRRVAERLKEEREVFLYGIGGIGKSAVARGYARLYRKRYDTVVYAVCERGLRELFADDTCTPVSHMTYAPGGKRAEMGWYVRRKLKAIRETADSRTLLVIDNFDRMRDPLLKEVLSLPCHVLVTTRTDPAYFGRQGIFVGALKDRDEWLKLFGLYYGSLPEAEQEAVLPLLEKFRGHTLYVKLLAGYCKGKGVLPSRLLPGEIRLKGDVFRFACRSSKERQVLRNAALLPAMGMEENRFFRLSGTKADSEAAALAACGLIEYDRERGWIALHPLVRQEITQTGELTWRACREYAQNLRMELAEFWNMPMKQKMGYMPYVIGILETLPLLDTDGMETVFFLTDLLWQFGQWGYALRRTRALYEECGRAFGPSHPFTACAAHLAASVYHNSRDRKRAALWYERAYLAYRDSAKKEPRRCGLYLMKYSRTLAWQGKPDQAEEALTEAEAIYAAELNAGEKESGLRSELQNTYIEHTRFCMAQGNYRRALALCQKAGELCDSINASKTTKAYILHDEAVIRQHLGEPERAGDCLRHALECARGYLCENQPERLEIEKKWRKKERGERWE